MVDINRHDHIIQNYQVYGTFGQTLSESQV